MVDIAPLDYERYAGLVSSLLIPGAVPIKPLPVSVGPEPLARIAGTSYRKHGDQNLGKSPNSGNIDNKHKPLFRSMSSIAAKHPDPATGRGQNVDFFT